MGSNPTTENYPMNTNFQKQMAANFVSIEIKRSGVNIFDFSQDSFTMGELTQVLDPNWKSPEQIQAEEAA